MAFSVFRFRRFSSRLLLLLAGLVALVQVAVYLLISHFNEENAREHIEQNLQTGARIFQQNLAERIDYLASSAKVMSSDYPIRQLMMQDPLDRRTLRSALQSYSEPGAVEFPSPAATDHLLCFRWRENRWPPASPIRVGRRKTSDLSKNP